MTESIESQKSPKNLNAHNYERFKKTLKNLIYATNNIKIGQLSYGVDDFTIAIDAPWGAGKSFLIHDFQEYIKNDKNIKTVIYNAWEDDQSQDPLFGLTMSIINAYSKKEEERISKIVKSLLRCVLVQGISLIKYYSYGSIDMRNILHEIQQEWNNNTKDYIAEFQDKNKKINTIFKETISELIRGGKSKQERDTKKLVIFIDELDRCKPNFAIQVLERVKHFFDIEGRQLIFVFAIDKEQLQHIIEHFYGKINSDKYLQKFFSFQLKLPYNSTEFFKTIVANYDFHNKPMNYRELLINMNKINYSGGLEFLLSHYATPRDLICFCREISRKCEAIEELGMPHEDACYQERQLHIIMWHYFLSTYYAAQYKKIVDCKDNFFMVCSDIIKEIYHKIHHADHFIHDCGKVRVMTTLCFYTIVLFFVLKDVTPSNEEVEHTLNKLKENSLDPLMNGETEYLINIMKNTLRHLLVEDLSSVHHIISFTHEYFCIRDGFIRDGFSRSLDNRCVSTFL